MREFNAEKVPEKISGSVSLQNWSMAMLGFHYVLNSGIISLSVCRFALKVILNAFSIHHELVDT